MSMPSVLLQVYLCICCVMYLVTASEGGGLTPVKRWLLGRLDRTGHKAAGPSLRGLC